MGDRLPLGNQTKRLVNLTGHKVDFLVEGEGEPGRVYLPADRRKVVCHDARHLLGTVRHVRGDGTVMPAIPIYRSEYTPVVGLPDPEEGVIFVVNGIVLRGLVAQGIHRADVMAVGDHVRIGGMVDGARALLVPEEYKQG